MIIRTIENVNDFSDIRHSYLKNLSAKKFTKIETRETNPQDFVVAYIISISFLKANTTIHVSDTKGNLKLFYSAGSVELSGKQKRKRRIAISKLISLVLKKANFLGQKPSQINSKRIINWL